MTPHPAARSAALTAPAPLEPHHDVSRFDCGKPSLDDWLRRHARRSEGKSARTYVVCQGGAVVGYYCVASGSAELDTLPPGKLRRNAPASVPLAIIGRLAVDKSVAGQGLGADLLRDALRRIGGASQVIGIRAVLVHALDDEARSFYLHQAEFLEFPADSRTLYLPIEAVLALI